MGTANLSPGHFQLNKPTPKQMLLSSASAPPPWAFGKWHHKHLSPGARPFLSERPPLLLSSSVIMITTEPASCTMSLGGKDCSRPLLEAMGVRAPQWAEDREAPPPGWPLGTRGLQKNILLPVAGCQHLEPAGIHGAISRLQRLRWSAACGCCILTGSPSSPVMMAQGLDQSLLAPNSWGLLPSLTPAAFPPSSAFPSPPACPCCAIHKLLN